MTVLLQNLGSFLVIALVAMFVQNAVFTRGFGVSRLLKLVGDSAVDSMVFCALLCLIQVISAPLGFFVNQYLAQPRFWFRDYIRPLALVVCAVVAFLIIMLIIMLVGPKNKKDLLTVLPLAAFNCAVLGPLLLADTQSFDFAQTVGFALGSGFGYGIAVILLTEGQRKLKSPKVPSTLRGLPINLLYIGILALAIYGLTGHRLVI